MPDPCCLAEDTDLHEKELSGLVLCGGQSSRMGSDKGLLIHNKKFWVSVVSDLLQNFVPEVYISLRQNQLPAYGKIFSPTQLIADSDEITAMGPLKGLASVQSRYPEKNWLVAACDMISLNQSVISGLIQDYQNFPEHDIYVYKQKETLEPLCAIYTGEAIHKMYKMSQATNNYSVQENLVPQKCRILSMDNEADSSALANYNTPGDISRNPL